MWGDSEGGGDYFGGEQDYFDANYSDYGVYDTGMSMEEYDSYSSNSDNFRADVATTGKDNGMGSQNGSNAPFAGWVAQGFANATAYYGAWYEGEQQNAYYKQQMQLTYREKQAFLRKFEYAYGEVKQAAFDATREVENLGRFIERKEKKYQEQSDTAIAAMMMKTAKSGVAMDFGSPLEYMGKIVDDRSEEFGLLKWGNQMEIYQGEQKAKNLSDKATIMLDESKTEMQNYDYQAAMFLQSAGDARRAARYKSYQAALNI